MTNQRRDQLAEILAANEAGDFRLYRRLRREYGVCDAEWVAYVAAQWPSRLEVAA